MPLIQMCGFPSSGKSKRATEIQEFFQKNEVEVNVISDQSTGAEKNDIYDDSRKEKLLRGNLKSAVQRDLSKDRITILDSLNYIKGFRYELYCLTKEFQTTQCVIYCDTNAEVASKWNSERDESERYKQEIFDGLVMRFEEPKSTNRWDSTLFIVQTDDTLPFEAIDDVLFNQLPNEKKLNFYNIKSVADHNFYLMTFLKSYHYSFDGLVMRFEEPKSTNRWDSTLFIVQTDDTLPFEAIDDVLFKKKAPPPNASTLPQPLSSTNFLYELDRITKEIVGCVMEGQKMGVAGDQIAVSGASEKVLLSRTFTLGELQRHRRQFITYTKMHPVDDPAKLANMFVQYLNKTLH